MENKLDPEFKAKWVKALRSGEYAQGKCMLFNPENNTFCCIGVAGSLRGLSKEQMTDKTTTEDSIYDECLPGISKSVMRRLTGMNDGGSSAGKPFTEIADYIEANL